MTDQLALAVDELAYAIAWTKKNPEAWSAVVSWAHEDHDAHVPVSTRTYCCILRRPHFAAKLGLRRMGIEPVLVNDHLSGDMARLLNRLYPYLNCPTRERVQRRVGDVG